MKRSNAEIYKDFENVDMKALMENITMMFWEEDLRAMKLVCVKDGVIVDAEE